jgi:tetraacyldisaccharide 4'-kinase
MNFLLIPLSVIFGLITSIRNNLFDIGLLNSKSFKIPIICIGNLSVGGAGKTPHTEYLLTILKKECKIAIVSRGYKRKNYNFSYVKTNSNYKDVGDEPLMLKRKNPEALVIVCGDRTKAINKIITDHLEIDVILLDDGFQHRWVNAGLNLLLTNVNNPFYNDYHLPYGNLRENKSQCKRADHIIITNNTDKTNESYKRNIRSEISKFSQKKCSFSKIIYNNAKALFNEEQIENLNNFNILLVTGIADTSSLIHYLQNETIINKHFKFKDHHNFNKENINTILSYYNSLKNIKKLILTTEKDSVKLLQYEEEFKDIAIYYLPIKIKFTNQEKFDKKILEYVKQY